MSNAITHYETRPEFYACGKAPGVFVRSTTDRSDVTCRRCLASLAKRDREFQRKARRAFPIVRRSLANAVGAPDVTPIALLRWNALARGCAKPGDAARAIAREEGRAP